MHLRVLHEAELVHHGGMATASIRKGLALLRDYIDVHWSHALEAFEIATSMRHKGKPMAIQSGLSVFKTVVVPLPLVEAFALFIQQDN